eukprot:gene4852-5099_t
MLAQSASGRIATLAGSVKAAAPRACRPSRQHAVFSSASAAADRVGKASAAAAVAEAPTSPVMSLVEMWNGKKLQTQVLPLAPDTVAIRSLDWDRDRFDIEFGLEKGTTYNAYLIFGETHTALVDASHEKFNNLQPRHHAVVLPAILPAQVSHTEPDHSYLVPAVLDLYPEATVVASKVALNFLKGLTNSDFKEMAVKGGDKLDLGGGHVMEFVMAPNLHWPDTMFSFDHATGVMYTCDAFGMHYCTEDPFDTDVEAIMPHYRFYYDCLMKPNSKSVVTALRKVSDLKYNTLANGHGPILRYNVEQLVENYKQWSLAVEKGTVQVAVLYSSDYGYSDRLSQSVAKGITKAGVKTEMVDVLSVDPQELVAILAASKGLVLMAPPSGDAEAQKTLAGVLSGIKPNTKPVDTLVAGLLGVGVEVLGDALRVKDTPSHQLYQAFEEAGTDLAQALTSKDIIARKKAAMCADVAKALGRISTGLYIVSAQQDNASSAMVASWVSQASFEPLGLTIAVAKDRAIESMMQVGDKFVLNCLGEDDADKIMKHFLKRFAAGADRFQGIEWFPAAGNKCPVLKDAIAYMECQVVSRLETPDHWITYAHVTSGEVINSDEKTAVHRRKVGNYY